MMTEIGGKLRDCRKLWWEGKRTTCLENKWVARLSSKEILVLDERGPGAKQVRSAEYDVDTRMMSMSSGTATTIASRAETRNDQTRLN